MTLYSSELVTDVSDMLGNIKPVVTMHRQAPYFRSFTKKLNALKKSLRKQSIAREALSCLRQLMMFSLLGLAAYMVLAWKVPAPELVVTMDQVRKIAETKLPDLNAYDVEGGAKIIAGTARSMGIDVIE